MIKYAAMICDSRRTCTRCPIKDLCKEKVDITKEALSEWENRIETKSEEVRKEKKHEKAKYNPVVSISFIDAITQISNRREEIHPVF